MKPPPDVIDGVLVRLRRPMAEDARALFLAAADPEVARYMDWLAPTIDSLTTSRLESATAARAQRWAAGAEYQWIVEERSSTRKPPISDISSLGRTGAKYWPVKLGRSSWTG